MTQIRETNCSIREASRRFWVPRGTLHDRLHGRGLEGSRIMGPDTMLITTEEEKLADRCVFLAKCGFPQKPEDIIGTVQIIGSV